MNTSLYNLILMTAQERKVTFPAVQPPFPHLSLSAAQTLLTKVGAFLPVRGLQLCFVYPWTPAVYNSCDFLLPGPCPQFSGLGMDPAGP